MFSADDKILIRECVLHKGWTPSRIMKEFSTKKWPKTTVYRIVKKIRENECVLQRKPGSGRPKSALNVTNLQYIDDNVCSQENNPGSHKSQREIAKDLQISQSSVDRGIKNLGKMKFKRIATGRKDGSVRMKRQRRTRQLLRKYTIEQTKKIIFTDEEDFSLEIPLTRQNDVIYGIVRGIRKRDVSPDRLSPEF